MFITTEQVKSIINEYERICKEEDANAVNWSLDDDNCGIDYNYPSITEICQMIAKKFNLLNN